MRWGIGKVQGLRDIIAAREIKLPLFFFGRGGGLYSELRARYYYLILQAPNHSRLLMFQESRLSEPEAPAAALVKQLLLRLNTCAKAWYVLTPSTSTWRIMELTK